MRLNSIGVILLLSFYLIVPTNGILHLILQGLSHSLNLNHGVSPNQLVQQMLNSPDILNGVAKNFDVGHLANVLQQQGDKWGINTDPRDLPQIIAAEKAKFEQRFPGFDFKQFLTGNTTEMTSYFKNENPDKVDEYLYSKPLESWTAAELYTWAKCTLPRDSLPTFENLNLSGRRLSKINRKFIESDMKIDSERIQDMILEEIQILEDTVNSNLKFEAETREKTKNENNGEMNEDGLHTIKQEFIKLKDHTDHTMITIEENVHKMQKLFSSKFLYHHTLKQIQKMSNIVQGAAYHIDILENALDKSLEEKFANFDLMKKLEEKVTTLTGENEELKNANSKKEQLLQENSEMIKKLESLAEEKDNALEQLKKSTDSKQEELLKEKDQAIQDAQTEFEKELQNARYNIRSQANKLKMENLATKQEEQIKREMLENQLKEEREEFKKSLEKQENNSRISQQWLSDKVAELQFQNKEKIREMSSNRLEIAALRKENTNLQQELKTKDDEITKLTAKIVGNDIDKSSPKNESYNDVEFESDETPKKTSYFPFSFSKKNTKK